MNIRILSIFVIAIAAIGGIAYYAQDRTPTRLRADTPNVVATGKEIYAAQCASCHGTDLEGQPNWQIRGPDGKLPAPPHDVSGHTWHHPDAQLINVTKFGVAAVAGKDYKTDMPAFEGILNDEEIVAALSYIKSTWPPDVQARHDQMSQH